MYFVLTNKMSKSHKSSGINKLINQTNTTKNKAAFAVKISNLLEYGRKEITLHNKNQILSASKQEFEKFPIGSLVSYMNIKNEFKQGGFIIKFSDDYFIFITLDFKTKYRVKYANVLTLWVGDVYHLSNDLMSLKKTSQNKTNFPVKIGKSIVYYGKNNFDKNRFLNTEKYKRMNDWYNYFNLKSTNKNSHSKTNNVLQATSDL
ncbi:hypothetical protein QLL95_gp0357 [Cotonvirus japonicus]|uniref:Uncharacterized protein n=1 Tax=Cotonvirus japonicus TaxID=2811091 RepID=A0ABM7NUI8_9VIRU|nr:hypothetical protein QLL95_gp0357 [Cotonvirus japonicus]BCS83766.1 hypothetical protein [Cotonvirus japonicus]